MAGKYQAGVVLEGTVYRVIRHVATGGMGSLYEVEDETVGRRYILKTLHPELVDREDLALRMRDEARSLGKLQHPNIVQVITAGVTAEATKTPFYVMELLVGQNLRAVLEARRGNGGIGAAHAYRIAIDVLGALQHAHENELVHRDVKPENIFLHRGPHGTVTKLLDFGIVRILNRHGSLTRGKFIGTLRYSSPEQVTGQRTIGPASDIYSLGLVLYELLSGRGPFDDAGDAFRIGAAHVSQVPPPLRHADVTPEVASLVMQALSKAPEGRPPTCAAFAAELKRALKQIESAPNAPTELDLLSARHPGLENDRTMTVPAGVETEDAQPATRLEGQGNAPISATLAAPTPPTPRSPLTPPSPLTPRGPLTPPTAPAATPHMAGPAVPAVIINEPPRAGAGLALDRDAPTRVSPPTAGEARIAAHDTHVETRTPRIETLKMIGAPDKAPSIAVDRKKTQQYISTVHTRPTKSGAKVDLTAVIALVVAAVIAAAMITGAVVFVRHGRPGVPASVPASVAPPK